MSQPDNITKLEQAYWEGRAESVKEIAQLKAEKELLITTLQDLIHDDVPHMYQGRLLECLAKLSRSQS